MYYPYNVSCIMACRGFPLLLFYQIAEITTDHAHVYSASELTVRRPQIVAHKLLHSIQVE